MVVALADAGAERLHCDVENAYASLLRGVEFPGALSDPNRKSAISGRETSTRNEWADRNSTYRRSRLSARDTRARVSSHRRKYRDGARESKESLTARKSRKMHHVARPGSMIRRNRTTSDRKGTRDAIPNVKSVYGARLSPQEPNELMITWPGIQIRARRCRNGNDTRLSGRYHIDKSGGPKEWQGTETS